MPPNLKTSSPMCHLTSEIAQAAKTITDRHRLPRKRGILLSESEPYGATKAKVSLDVHEAFSRSAEWKIHRCRHYPHATGETKSTTMVGLCQALAYLDQKVFTCIRPSPARGLRLVLGRCRRGGYSQVIRWRISTRI